MRIIYIFMFLLSLLTSHAQDNTIFAPPGATWYYSPHTLFLPHSLVMFVSEGDTLINGISARILQFYDGESGVLQPVDSLNKYTYTSGNQVFYWVEDDFYLLFDFDALPGDTIYSRVEYFPVFMGCASDFSNGPIDFSYVVDSLGTMMIDGVVLRVQHITSIYGDDPSWYMDGPIIERIGLNWYSNFFWGRGYGCILGGHPGFLRCYEDEDIFHRNPGEDCDEISAVYPFVEKIKPIYPNPSHNFIILPTTADLIEVYNYTGNKLGSYKNQDNIDITTFQPNIYFIRYRSKNVWFVEKFIKF